MSISSIIVAGAICFVVGLILGGIIGVGTMAVLSISKEK